MSRATSSGTGRRYGLARVARVWNVSRATHYRRRPPAEPEQPPAVVTRRRPGPVGACSDDDLLAYIRDQILASRLHGEGYRKIWARLRHDGIRTSARRVRRLMRAHRLLAPHRTPKPRRRRDHDGTITTGRSRRDDHDGTITTGRSRRDDHDGTITTAMVNAMWGTDMTQTVTVLDGVARVFVAVDHANSECVGIHAARSGNRFEALEPVRQGVLRHVGPIGEQVAAGLQLRHDHGSNDMSGDFQAEIRFLGIESSPAFVREPEGNGVAERFIRTLKENFLWGHTFDTLEELRQGLLAFARHYNETWLVARHGYKTPAQVRADQLGVDPPPDAPVALAA
jgi:putative transposase